MGRMAAVQQVAAAAMVGVAMGVTAFLAVLGNEAAQGALIAVLSTGTSYFMRGRVANPSP